MIARRKALHRVWKADFVVCIASVFVRFPDVRGCGNEDLVVMECENHTELERVAGYLICRGLNMARNGAFEDFAIVHGTRGIPLPCDWLEYRLDAEGSTVRFISDHQRLDLGAAGNGYDGPGWMPARGHGFVISQQDDYDVWLDFETGGTVVSLRPPHPPQFSSAQRILEPS